MTVHLMIPARYASTRLPGKVLLPLAGKPMIQHVYERAIESGVGAVHIVCDDERVAEVAAEFADQIHMTDPACISGTARITEVVQRLGLPASDQIINVQGDEPFIEPEKIQLLAELLSADPLIPMVTLAHPIDDPVDLSNPNVVKVVLDGQGRALYFSRSLIPWAEQPKPQDYLRHLGLYGYRVEFLKTLAGLPSSPLQLTEKLEQLSVLYHGYAIKVGICEKPAFIDINTREDYEQVVRLLG